MRITYALLAVGLLAMNVARAADERPPVPVPDAAASSASEAEPIALYHCVKVEDRDNIHPCAVSMIVSVADPCNPCCCRFVEICVPPNCCPKISTRRKGTKVEYDFGEYEVDIYSKKNVVVVNYDD